jgi:hypothetical protein
MRNKEKDKIIQECLEFLSKHPDVPSEWQEMNVQSLYGSRLAKHSLSAREVCQRYNAEIDDSNE